MGLQQLVPGFLQRLDNYLLKNKPAVWSSRIHKMLFFTGILNIFFFILLLFINNDPRVKSSEVTWIILLSIIIIITIVVFCIYLFRFNVMKRFGEWSSKDSLLSFIFYFVIFFFIYSLGFLPSITEYLQANTKYNYKELADDQNQYTKAIALLHKDSLDFSVSVNDTIVLITDTAYYTKRSRYQNTTDYNYEDVTTAVEVATITSDEASPATVKRRELYYKDSSEYNTLLEETDSLVVLSDTSFIRYTLPKFNFLSEYQTGRQNNMEHQYKNVDPENEESYDHTLWSDLEIYHELMKDFNKNNTSQYNAIIQKIQYKYLLAEDISEFSPNNYRLFIMKRSYSYNNSYFSYLQNKYYCNEIDNNISNILHRKAQWEPSECSFKMSIWYYLSIISAIFLWLFRNNTKKSFFLSFLIAGLLLLVSSIFVIIMDFKELGIYVLILFYFLFFLGVSLNISKLRIQRVLPAIATNFIVSVTLFIPLYLVYFIFYLKEEALINRNNYYALQEIYHNRMAYMAYVEYVGLALLLVMIYFVYSKLYKKWIALPDE